MIPILIQNLYFWSIIPWQPQPGSWIAGAAPDSCPAFWEPRQLGMEMGGATPVGSMAQGISGGMSGGMPGQQVMHQANQQLSQHEMKQPLVQSNHLANQWLNYQANQVKLEQPSQVKQQGIHQPSLVQNCVTQQLSLQSQGIAGTPQGYRPTNQPRWSPPAVPFASPMTQPLHVFPSKDASRPDLDQNWVEFGLTRSFGV